MDPRLEMPRQRQGLEAAGSGKMAAHPAAAGGDERDGDHQLLPGFLCFLDLQDAGPGSVIAFFRDSRSSPERLPRRPISLCPLASAAASSREVVPLLPGPGPAAAHSHQDLVPACVGPWPSSQQQQHHHHRQMQAAKPAAPGAVRPRPGPTSHLRRAHASAPRRQLQHQVLRRWTTLNGYLPVKKNIKLAQFPCM